MRITNRSDVRIDRALWRRLAEPFGLNGELPMALKDEFRLYAVTALTVVVRPRRPRESNATSGWYSCGQIALFPCPHCAPGFLMSVFLHELFHAWLSQTDDDLYMSWKHCDTAELFSNRAFEILGGRWKPGRCGAYKFPNQVSSSRLGKYRQYVESLVVRRGDAIKQWEPEAEARRLTTSSTRHTPAARSLPRKPRAARHAG
jgi:hypothetical protein